MRRCAFLLPLAFAIAGCGGDDAGDNKVEALEAAAEQSTPAAAEVLENAAEQAEEGNVSIDAAMQAAGNAQVRGGTAPTPAPPQRQAKPHAKGDPVPPPTIPAGEADTAEHNGH